MTICQRCGCDPCMMRTVHEEFLRGEAEMLDSSLDPNEARKRLYRLYTRAVHRPLGRGIRKVAPDCVAELIRELFPDPDGNYMGHKWN